MDGHAAGSGAIRSKMARIYRELQAELRWALRNLRGRSWRAVLAIALLAVALAADTIVFSTADSLAFHRVLYPARPPST
jgi:hypothetical protein